METEIDTIKYISVIVKWSGKEYPISDLTEYDTVAQLKHEIYKRTEVRPDRQKLINLKYKGKVAPDELKLNALELKANFKLMMVGSLEADIEGICNSVYDNSDIVDDFGDICDNKKNIAIANYGIYLHKIKKRVKSYDIKILNPSRPGKKLLVLDIDYTLFDHRTPASTGSELMRPFLHEFLTAAYEHYDIVIWSATGMRWIEEKMKLLGVDVHIDYRIMFYLDWTAMISVYTEERGVLEVKPLGVIWGKFEQYTSKNTIMFDDIRRNFIMNPKSGLVIKPFRNAHINRDKDRELLKLSVYLKRIAENCDDFDKLDHSKWERYDP